MSISGDHCRSLRITRWVVTTAAVILFLTVGPVFASSETGHGTDTHSAAHSTDAVAAHSTDAAEAHSAEGAHGGGHGGTKGWVATDTYRVMNFAVLAIGLFLLLKKPVAKALGARITDIKEQLEDLEAKKRDAEKELAQYNERLALLSSEAEKIVSEYIKQGNEAKERILKEAESAADKLEQQARRNIDHEFEKAKKQLQADALEKALEKAEEIIKEKISTGDQERLVDEYLEKVVA